MPFNLRSLARGMVEQISGTAERVAQGARGRVESFEMPDVDLEQLSGRARKLAGTAASTLQTQVNRGLALIRKDDERAINAVAVAMALVLTADEQVQTLANMDLPENLREALRRHVISLAGLSGKNRVEQVETMLRSMRENDPDGAAVLAALHILFQAASTDGVVSDAERSIMYRIGDAVGHTHAQIDAEAALAGCTAWDCGGGSS